MNVTDAPLPVAKPPAAPARATSVTRPAFRDALSPPPRGAVPPVSDRQDDAPPGKTLPDEDREEGDGVSPWLAALLMPAGVQPVAPASVPTAPPISVRPELVEGRPTPQPIAAGPTVATASNDASKPLDAFAPNGLSDALRQAQGERGLGKGAGNDAISAGSVRAAPDGAAAAPSANDGLATRTTLATPKLPHVAPPRQPDPAALPVATLRAGAAREVFADALSRGPASRRREEPAGEAGPLSPLAPAAPIAVAKVGEAAGLQPTDGALHRMIDHIERLRDDADASDTRIRLKPDQLGTIDVAVRREGSAMHVHFTAETPATRTILADAQPRLETLAAERGLSLTGSSVGGGDARERPAPAPPATPSLRPRAADAAPADTIDLRLA